MNETELLEYMAKHKGLAHVGSEESLESAKSLEERELVKEAGSLDGNPYYRLTEEGEKAVGKSGKTKTKNTLTKLLHGLQDYAEAYRKENPVGIRELTHFGEDEE